MSRADAIPVGRRTSLVLIIASAAGLAVIMWPLLMSAPDATMGEVVEAPLLLMAILPLIIFTVLAQMADGGMDSKALAMLGVLSALNAALRPLGAGLGGVETVFFMLILAGRVYGAGFGFVFGATSLFASALLTAGVGPWLPFQMLTSAWIGLGAGLLPKKITGKAEIVLLAAYGAVSAYVFGALMNFWFWPLAAGAGAEHGSLAFIPGAPVLDNLKRFFVFTLLTSTGGWDTGRAITNVVAIVVLGPAILAVLRRAVRKASFGAPVEFTYSEASPSPGSEDSSSESSEPSGASSVSSWGATSVSSRSSPASDSSGIVTGTQSGSGGNGSSGTKSTNSTGFNSL